VAILTNLAEGGTETSTTSNVWWAPIGSDNWTHLDTTGPISFEVEADTEYRVDACLNFAPAAITFRFGPTRLHPRIYRLLFGRRHPCITAMHSAYRRRRK